MSGSRSGFAPDKHLAEVVPVDGLPRTPSGKLLRRLLV